MNLIACYAKTHHGPYLSINEDNYHFDFDNELYMVLDAFGGSGYGDEGLKLAMDNIGNFFEKITEDPEATQPFFYNPQLNLETNALINSISYTHKLLLKKNSSKPLDERAGVSGAFLVKDNSLVNLVNIGTTKAYLLRDGSLKLLADEQSLNNFEEEDTLNIPQFSLGLVDNLHYSLKTFQVEKNDQVLLMSDGVHKCLSESDILTQALGKDEKREIIENLFQLANNKGNKDNQTLLILEF